jgi:TRAP-type C4-dicarboxylate transport system substrate-binding protein
VSLRETDEQWRKVSGGAVRMKIYAGTLGDETDIMRRVRVGQIDAAAISAAGLSTIDPAMSAMNIPMAFASNKELDYVWQRLKGRLEKILRDKGYVVLNWATAGWVHFFTKAPVRRFSEMRKLKLFVWTTADVAVVERMWRRMGFHPVPLSTVDILPGLQTGMIGAFQSPPIMALANQWFPFTGYMSDVKWAPLVGATVVAARKWRRIPAGLRKTLVKISRAKSQGLNKAVRRMEQQAIRAMVKRGLKVVPVSPDAVRDWRKLTETIYPDIRGRMIPAAYFDEVLKLRDEYRNAASKRTLADR